ncbi:hypothetical protein HOY82DRAFT_618874 [Tuber indicum]|nr:hypothetical protein HOY82DRAFT_618874 [Tuber indicum]
MAFFSSNLLPSMRTKAGGLKSPPYFPPGERRKLPQPNAANIIPLNYVPFNCRQAENPKGTISDRDLERKVGNQLKLSSRMKEELERARERGDTVYRHSFRVNRLLENTIEVFLTVDRKAPRPKLSIPNATLQETESLGETFERIDIGDCGFYVALDKNLEKIFVLFGTGLKLIYGDTIGQYITEALCWNVEEYAELSPRALPKDRRHKEYENWLLANPHLCWPPWARAGVYHWGLWMEQGHENRGSVLNRDIYNTGGYAEYESLLHHCGDEKKMHFATDEKEIFTLRACLVNVFTEPHFDRKDIKGG